MIWISDTILDVSFVFDIHNTTITLKISFQPLLRPHLIAGLVFLGAYITTFDHWLYMRSLVQLERMVEVPPKQNSREKPV